MNEERIWEKHCFSSQGTSVFKLIQRADVGTEKVVKFPSYSIVNCDGSKQNFSRRSRHYHAQYDMLHQEDAIPLFCDKPSVFGLEEDPVQFYIVSKKLENDVLCLTPDLIRDSSPHFIDRPELFNSLICAGVVSGVALLHWKGEYLGLWNPATREFKAIPHPRPNNPDNVKEGIANFLGFGFDFKCNDFKVIRSIEWMIRLETGWERTYIYEMYSLRSDSWKTLEVPHNVPCHCLYMHESVTDGYFNGVHYWPANELDDAFNTRHIWMLTFNFSTNTLKLIDPPPRVCGEGPKWEWSVGKYKEFLAAIFTGRNEEDHECVFQIWIVTKFDDDDPVIPVSWQNLFTIGPVPAFDGLWFSAFLTDDDLLLTVQGGEGATETVGGFECALYSPSTGALKRMGIGLGNCLRYVESLYSFHSKKE
ncbi:hypothetical protein Cgig2_027002 [Carnegiea gigantea]|uniref:F-box associated beta-propeller type 1 domain-containing protein n=1 Tax=Carnegiea gigantea TaxID=171969 RepID=A0A9Q1Q854_9CARY|nr:hypothetical protein Cgig2_027002 [Carnegiea gigantea]